MPIAALANLVWAILLVVLVALFVRSRASFGGTEMIIKVLYSVFLAVVVVVVSVGLSGRLPVISEGLLLGGLFTLIYSIGFSFMSSPKVAVIPVGVGLILTIALGYKRFARKT